MSRSLLAVCIAIVSLASHAQDSVATDPDKYKVIFENECVRVLDYKDLPGQKTSQHSHPAFVLYSLSTFKRNIQLADGKMLQREFKPGDVMWSNAQTHIGTNSGDTPTHVVLVETKSAIGTCASR